MKLFYMKKLDEPTEALIARAVELDVEDSGLGAVAALSFVAGASVLAMMAATKLVPGIAEAAALVFCAATIGALLVGTVISIVPAARRCADLGVATADKAVKVVLAGFYRPAAVAQVRKAMVLGMDVSQYRRAIARNQRR